MFNQKKQLAYKAMGLFMILSIMLTMPLSATQTIGELQKEIEDIQADTEAKLAEKEEIEVEKASTKADILDVKAEVDEIAANITAKETEIANKNAEITTQNQKIEEIQAQIPEVAEDAGEMLSVLQKTKNGNTMVEMVLSPTDNEGDNILRRMDAVNDLAEFAGDVVLELVSIEQELQYEKTVLEKDEAELEAAQVELETEQRNLTVKESQLEDVLAAQSDAAESIEASVDDSAEQAAILQDTLDFYESYGCSADDFVGSNCGGLGDDDGDGVINDEDSCPNEAGDQADGCPGDDDGDGINNNQDSCPNDAADTADGCPVEVPEEDKETPSGGGDSSGGGSSGGGGGISTASTFAKPLSSGAVTCNWGCYSGHTGIDLDNADYDPIYSTANGVVITARGGCSAFGGYLGNSCNGGYGNYVMIMHSTSSGVVFSLYGHMSSIAVSQGQTVSQGTQVGTLGHSGNSSASHLHFELFPDSNGNGLPDDYRSDPRNYVSFPAQGSWW